MKPSGYVLSLRNSVVAILTGFVPSENPKTGDMLQAWILNADVDPVTAVKTGANEKVCGNCPLKGLPCYVSKFQAPLSVYKKFKAGGYPEIDWSQVNGRKVRLGAYGDPAYVDVGICHELTSRSSGWTGYTHQWQWAVQLKPYVMASVESVADQCEAVAAGWRSFRIRKPGQPKLVDEVVCPASDEAGNKTTCERCPFCCGRSNRGKSVVIYAHDHGAKYIDL
jgi:hypothetical protein